MNPYNIYGLCRSDGGVAEAVAAFIDISDDYIKPDEEAGASLVESQHHSYDVHSQVCLWRSGWGKSLGAAGSNKEAEDG